MKVRELIEQLQALDKSLGVQELDVKIKIPIPNYTRDCVHCGTMEIVMGNSYRANAFEVYVHEDEENERFREVVILGD